MEEILVGCTAFAESYVDRNEEDHYHFREAVRTGRIVARTGQ